MGLTVIRQMLPILLFFAFDWHQHDEWYGVKTCKPSDFSRQLLTH